LPGFDDGLPPGEADPDDPGSYAEAEAELDELADQAAVLLAGIAESSDIFKPSDDSKHRQADKQAFAGLV